MIRSVVRAALVCIGAGAIGALLLIAGARWSLPAIVHGPIAEDAWTARSRALFTPSGFQRPELDEPSGHFYSWTTDHADLEFPNLARSIAYAVTLQIRHARPADITPPTVRMTVDGQLVLSADTATTGNRLEFEIPRRDQSGARVTFEVSPVYRPGGTDPRVLGVIIDDVAMAPVHGAFPVRAAVAAKTALVVALCALALWLLGLRGALFGASALGIVAGIVWLLLKDAAFAGAYIDRLVTIAVGAALVGVVLGLVRLRWPDVRAVSPWSVAAGLILAATVIKLGVLWHPLAIVGDGFFQVHRAQAVHAGDYFFTSVTPRPFYEFPYPIALYLVAQPFWHLFLADLDLVRLLRLIALMADALAGLALFAAARRQWPSSRAPLFVAALYPFARAPLEALSNSNLTNMFGQGVFSMAIAALAFAAASGSMPWAALALALVLLAVAFLSHFGTLTVGLCVLGAIAAGTLVAGRGVTRRVGVGICAVTLLAAAVSWFAYYGRPEFRAVYATTYQTMTNHQADDSSKMDAAPSVKLQRWWSGVGDDYGRPGVAVLLAAAAGIVLVIRRRAPEGGAIVFLSWTAAWLALSAVGIFSSLTLRANLAAAPVFMLFGAVALAALADRSRAGLVLACGAFAVMAWDGWRVAVACLDLTGAR